MRPVSPNSQEPLLSFSRVERRLRDGTREMVVLKEVSFELHAGASAGVYGRRRSGKSTLLRLAAAIEAPDAGTIRLDGRDVMGVSAGERARLMRSSVALLRSGDWLPSPGETVLDHVAMSLGSVGFTLREARRMAFEMLERVGISGVGTTEMTAALSLREQARVMLARALVRGPGLLVVDEPAPMPSLAERDEFCALIRSQAREREIALLMASEDMTVLQGLEVLMSLSAGELCSTEVRSAGEHSAGGAGTVVQLPRRHAAAT
jgi:predicted ABC-type transport system involved in lysophospholipase L1 biosynthesis ATPase subunit